MFVNCFDVLCNNIFLRGHLPEDGNTRQSKQVEGQAFYTTINVHICIWTCWFLLLILVQDVHTEYGKYIAINIIKKVHNLWNIKTFPV